MFKEHPLKKLRRYHNEIRDKYDLKLNDEYFVIKSNDLKTIEDIIKQIEIDAPFYISNGDGVYKINNKEKDIVVEVKIKKDCVTEIQYL